MEEEQIIIKIIINDDKFEYQVRKTNEARRPDLVLEKNEEKII